MLTHLVVYIIALYSSLNTITFCLLHVFPVFPHPTRFNRKGSVAGIVERSAIIAAIAEKRDLGKAVAAMRGLVCRRFGLQSFSRWGAVGGRIINVLPPTLAAPRPRRVTLH
jgi:hypothetical protein